MAFGAAVLAFPLSFGSSSSHTTNGVGEETSVDVMPAIAIVVILCATVTAFRGNKERHVDHRPTTGQLCLALAPSWILAVVHAFRIYTVTAIGG